MSYIDSYIRVYNDNLRNVNKTTIKIWDSALECKNGCIFKIREKELDEYLISFETYNNLINAARLSENGKDPFGIPNVNFSLIKESDQRWKVFQQQRLERGFDDSETWSLESTISRFIEPRLKAFKECCIGYPSDIDSQEEWLEILDKMIKAFELINTKDFPEVEENEMIDEGLDLFRKYFHHLWW